MTLPEGSGSSNAAWRMGCKRSVGVLEKPVRMHLRLPGEEMTVAWTGGADKGRNDSRVHSGLGFTRLTDGPRVAPVCSNRWGRMLGPSLVLQMRLH